MTPFEIACRRLWRNGKNTYQIARQLSEQEWPYEAVRQVDGWVSESAVYNALAKTSREVRHAA